MNKLISLLLVLFLEVLAVNGYRIKRQTTTCSTPNNFAGNCVQLSDCPLIKNLYDQRERSPQNSQFILLSYKSCGSRSSGNNPIVCCQRPNVSVTRPTSATPTNNNCRTQNSEDGQCIDLRQCDPYMDILRKQEPTSRVFLQRSNAICGGVGNNVCCPKNGGGGPTNPTNSKYRLFSPPNDDCGVSSSDFTRIIGGQPAELNDWPWMALLGYTDNFGDTNFGCGGTIITNRHILTAAHCIRRQLRIVRIGEYDLSNDTETRHEDIRISRIISHPEFNDTDKVNDLAILVLERDIQFRTGVRPVCIPFGEPYVSKSYVSFNPFVTGWGRTLEDGKTAEILQVLQLPVLQNKDCETRYLAKNRWRSQRQFGESVICAGILKGGQDTCQGDSGGPLVIPEQINGKFHFFQIGVVSYGIKCARPEVPSIYTNIQYFSQWIAEKIAEPV